MINQMYPLQLNKANTTDTDCDSKSYRRQYELISKFNVGLKALLRDHGDCLSEPEFHSDWVYKFKKLIGRILYATNA